MLNCPLCDKVFNSRVNLRSHLMSHTKERPHKCLTCSTAFGYLDTLKKHIKVIHEGVKLKTWVQEKKLNCLLCDYKCSSGSTLNRHLQKHSTELPFSCSVPGCDFKGKCERSVVLHVQRMHNDGERPHACTSEGCNYKTNCSSNLRRHFKINCTERPFVCNVEGCDYTCKYKSSLKEHTLNRHSEETPWKCSICDFRTKYKAILRKHENEHKNFYRFRCQAPKCTFATNTNSSLRSHFGRKHTKKHIKCAAPGCNFRCGTSALLKIHAKRTHTSPILKCPVDLCNFSTRVLPDLREHVSSTHQELETTSRMALRRSNLQTVGAVDVLICAYPKCDYQTEFQHRYDRHLKTHVEENRKFVCKFCSYRSSKIQILQSHIQRRHLGEKPYSCSVCNFATACSRELRLHAGRIHQIYVIPRRKESRLMETCRTCTRKFASHSEFVLHSFTHLKAVVVLDRLNLQLM